MRSELSDVLERGAERPTVDPDFTELARRGRRRRYAQRTSQGLAVVAVIALTAGVVLPRLRAPEVMFDSGPRGGVGTWEAVPPAPIETRAEADSFADEQRLIVYGGRSVHADGRQGDALDGGAAFDRRTKQWHVIPAAPFRGPVELLDDGRLAVINPYGTRAATYDFRSGKWEQTAPSPAPRGNESIWHWEEGRLVVWGTGAERNEGAVWDDANRQWVPMPPAPIPNHGFSATAFDGEHLVVWGGLSGNPQTHAEVAHDDGAVYSVRDNSWHEMPRSPLEPRADAQALIDGNRVVIAGGSSAETPVKRSQPSQAPKVTCEESTGGDGTEVVGSCGVEAGAEAVGTFETYGDGAVYDLGSRDWTPIQSTSTARDRTLFLVDDRLMSLRRGRLSIYDVERDRWIGHSAPPRRDGPRQTFEVAGRLVVTNTDNVYKPAVTPKRIGGFVLDERSDTWQALTEADTPLRAEAAIATAPDALFVWGGVVLEHAGTGAGDYNRYAGLNDGAILTLD